MSTILNQSMVKQLVLVGAVALALTACGKKDEAPAAEATAEAPAAAAAPVLEGQLDIIAWPGYIERGESDKAYDWVTEFEKSTSLQGQRQDRGNLG